MKFVFINDIHVENEEDLPRLHEALRTIEKTHRPDWIVQLGDLIRAKSEREDRKNYAAALNCFSNLHTPVIHTIGNHECKYLSYQDIQELWRENGIKQDLFGSIETSSFHILWISVSRSVLRPWSVPEKDLRHLKNALDQSNKPKIILSHLPLLEYNTEGSLYAHEGYFATNREKVKSILFSHPIKAIFHAHTHFIHIGREERVPFITLPPYLDKLESRKLNEVYTVVEFCSEQIQVKCFAKEFFYAAFHLENSLR